MGPYFAFSSRRYTGNHSSHRFPAALSAGPARQKSLPSPQHQLRRAWSAKDGALLWERQGEVPDGSVFEEFFTDHLRIESPLHTNGSRPRKRAWLYCHRHSAWPRRESRTDRRRTTLLPDGSPAAAAATQDCFESAFAVVDMDKLAQTGGFSAQTPFHLQVDETGICISNDNLLVRIDPETGEQTELAYPEKDITLFRNTFWHRPWKEIVFTRVPVAVS